MSFIPHEISLCVFSVLEDASTRLSAVELKLFIITGLKSLYGEVRLLTRLGSAVRFQWTDNLFNDENNY